MSSLSLGHLFFGPHKFSLFSAIHVDNLAMNMATKIVACKGHDRHCDRFDGHWLT
jgi:hypothetical protein